MLLGVKEPSLPSFAGFERVKDWTHSLLTDAGFLAGHSFWPLC